LSQCIERITQHSFNDLGQLGEQLAHFDAALAVFAELERRAQQYAFGMVELQAVRHAFRVEP
jgi:hypothetical protein